MKNYVRHIRSHKKSILAAAVFIILALGARAAALSEAENADPSLVTRAEQGGDAESQTFTYRIDGGDEQSLTLDVDSVGFSEEEAMALLETAAYEWGDEYLGDNASADAVSSDLCLSTSFCDGAVSVSYESGDYDLLSADGSINWENLETDSEAVKLDASFSCGDCQRLESRLLNVTHPAPDSEEWLNYQLSQKAKSAEESSRLFESFSLPSSLGNHSITWTRAADQKWIFFFLLALLSVFCLEWREKTEERKRAQRRRDRLLFEYPRMVDQMSMLLGSGMTIRAAWEKMTAPSMRGANGSSVYLDEMRITYREMRRGLGEHDAYERFGTRIGLLPYRRFSSLLSQNLSKGTRNIKSLMDEEVREALELRKNHARKLGEEAGTKLLFPMLLMFMLILAILLIPAMQNLGI